jgi:hypothetical protein
VWRKKRRDETVGIGRQRRAERGREKRERERGFL